VIWDYADEPIPKDVVADLQNFVKAGVRERVARRT